MVICLNLFGNLSILHGDLLKNVVCASFLYVFLFMEVVVRSFYTYFCLGELPEMAQTLIF